MGRPVYHIAVYDPETGEITGRVHTNSRRVMEHYGEHCIAVPPEEAAIPLERTHTVDIAHMRATGHKRLKKKQGAND